MRKKGNFIFPVNFEPTGQSILDARLKVPTKEDLTTGYQDGNYYPKMVVTVEDEDAQYILSKEDPTQIDNWKKLNGGEGFSTISWDNSSNMNNYKDEGIYIISGVRSNSGDNMPISNYNTNGYIGGTLIINKTPEDPETKEYIISQNLVLANKVGGETKEYIRSCIVKNQIETWTPWKETNMIQLFGEKASGLASDTDINAAIDNGQYMGVYTGSTLMPTGSTFTMTVINNYAANAQTGQPNNRQVTQIFFYTPLSTDGQINPSNIVKRDGIGGDSIVWGDVQNITNNSYIISKNTAHIDPAYQAIQWEKTEEEFNGLKKAIADKKQIFVTTPAGFIPLTVQFSNNNGFSIQYTLNGSILGFTNRDSFTYLYGVIIQQAIFKIPRLQQYNERTYTSFDSDLYILDIGGFTGLNERSSKTLQEVVNGKQDTLVSGTSIKTVNGQSILGEGNIEIQGSGGGIADAPSDGNKYVRQNGNWVQETSVDTSAFATKEYINQLLTLEIVE